MHHIFSSGHWSSERFAAARTFLGPVKSPSPNHPTSPVCGGLGCSGSISIQRTWDFAFRRLLAPTVWLISPSGESAERALKIGTGWLRMAMTYYFSKHKIVCPATIWKAWTITLSGGWAWQLEGNCCRFGFGEPQVGSDWPNTLACSWVSDFNPYPYPTRWLEYKGNSLKFEGGPWNVCQFQDRHMVCKWIIPPLYGLGAHPEQGYQNPCWPALKRNFQKCFRLWFQLLKSIQAGTRVSNSCPSMTSHDHCERFLSLFKKSAPGRLFRAPMGSTCPCTIYGAGSMYFSGTGGLGLGQGWLSWSFFGPLHLDASLVNPSQHPILI